ncbi:hypothetical protein AWC15_06845 [Mycobacterium lacus]|uniref:Uncharacterized protein n=1 Tax=Mycobacterium lacus TaxID=169765 RepID=A0A1X1XTV8_9MYCO|nr:hypothetical protein AWC15_06845 [Mycobacterium lacus]BBX98913.1 hypothetical protein MLAC_42070 [Mycobacterium lacus]
MFRGPGSAPVHARTTSAFLDRWAAGEVSWDDGRASGDVLVDGPESAWARFDGRDQARWTEPIDDARLLASEKR